MIYMIFNYCKEKYKKLIKLLYINYYINDNINYIQLNNAYISVDSNQKINLELNSNDKLQFISNYKKSYSIIKTDYNLITDELIQYILNYDYKIININPIFNYDIEYKDNLEKNHNIELDFEELMLYLGPNYDNYNNFFKIKLKDINNCINKITINTINNPIESKIINYYDFLKL